LVSYKVIILLPLNEIERIDSIVEAGWMDGGSAAG